MCRESVLCCTLSVLAAAQQGKDDRSGGNMVCDTLQFQWSPGPRLMRWITGKLFKKANKKNPFPLDFCFVAKNPMLNFACSICSSTLSCANIRAWGRAAANGSY